MDALTQYLSPVAQSRDWFDYVVGIFTISTGLVLALAAAIAFVVQRGRYIHEAEPNLRVSLPSIAIGRRKDMASHLPIDVSVEIENVSDNPAILTSVQMHVGAFEKEGEWHELHLCRIDDMTRRSLPPSERFRWSGQLDDDWEKGTAVGIVKVRYHVSIQLEYRTRSEFLIRVLNGFFRPYAVCNSSGHFTWSLRRIDNQHTDAYYVDTSDVSGAHIISE